MRSAGHGDSGVPRVHKAGPMKCSFLTWRGCCTSSVAAANVVGGLHMTFCTGSLCFEKKLKNVARISNFDCFSRESISGRLHLLESTCFQSLTEANRLHVIMGMKKGGEAPNVHANGINMVHLPSSFVRLTFDLHRNVVTTDTSRIQKLPVAASTKFLLGQRNANGFWSIETNVCPADEQSNELNQTSGTKSNQSAPKRYKMKLLCAKLYKIKHSNSTKYYHFAHLQMMFSREVPCDSAFR